MAVTIKDVAAAAGVSTATVSHVFNATRVVIPETAARVRAAAEKLGYVPSVNASSLRSNRSKRIGFLVPSIASFFSVDILDAVEQVLLQNGYQMVFGCSHERLEREKEQIDYFNYQQIDGLLMFPAPGDHHYLDELPREYPIVFLDRTADGCVRDTVTGEDYAATYRATAQMIEEGHTHIGVINGLAGISSLTERLRGYCQAMQDHGLPIDEAMIQNGGSTANGGYAATECLLKNEGITAILTLTRSMALGSMQYLNAHKIAIPQQIALLCFGDDEWSSVTNPPLSTMRHPMFEMGQTAAKILLERIAENAAGSSKKPYETYRLPIELIRRESF